MTKCPVTVKGKKIFWRGGLVGSLKVRIFAGRTTWEVRDREGKTLGSFYREERQKKFMKEPLIGHVYFETAIEDVLRSSVVRNWARGMSD